MPGLTAAAEGLPPDLPVERTPLLWPLMELVELQIMLVAAIAPLPPH